MHSLFGFLARHEAIRRGHAARIGLVGIEYTTLISIRHLDAEEGDVNVNRVAEHLHLSGAFVTTVTNKLLKRGLIHKSVDPADRRRVKLQVSEKGDALLAELAPVQRQVERRGIRQPQSGRIPATARHGRAADRKQRRRRALAGLPRQQPGGEDRSASAPAVIAAGVTRPPHCISVHLPPTSFTSTCARSSTPVVAPGLKL